MEVLLHIYINFILVLFFAFLVVILFAFLLLSYIKLFLSLHFFFLLSCYFFLLLGDIFNFVVFFCVICYIFFILFVLHFTAAVVAIAKGHEATKYSYYIPRDLLVCMSLYVCVCEYSTQIICCVGRSTHVQKPLLFALVKTLKKMAENIEKKSFET